jgi:hypothetical protein
MYEKAKYAIGRYKTPESVNISLAKNNFVDFESKIDLA